MQRALVVTAITISLTSLALAQTQGRPEEKTLKTPQDWSEKKTSKTPQTQKPEKKTSKPPDTEKPVPSSTIDEIGQNEVVRIKTSLVTVPATITDSKNKYVVDLRREDFRVYEDGIEQEIAFFSPAELLPADKPLNVALLLDVSDSMQFQIEHVQNAAITFVDQLRPEDRVLVASFDRRVQLLNEATTDRSVIHDAIRRAKFIDGGTGVYNAVEMIINQRLRGTSGRNAIVLFSDGVDTGSRGATSVTNVRSAEAAGVAVYPVQYNTLADAERQLRSRVRQSYPDGPIIFSTPVSSGKSRRKAFDEATIYLRTLARNTGGRFYYIDGIDDLALAFTRIAEELRQQYVLGYYPKSQASHGQRREIKVTVNRPDLKVRARKSYVFEP